MIFIFEKYITVFLEEFQKGIWLDLQDSPLMKLPQKSTT